MKNKYHVIGIMSGTSLDGLDIAYCEFEKKRVWKYRIVYAKTKKYDRKWRKKLKGAFRKPSHNIKQIDHLYGEFIGYEILRFIKQKSIPVDFVASHGHTIFHYPQKKITLQIGSGARIASICKLPVVCDFRSGDVMLGGQGAPLVPIADKMLFPQYDYCLNLGGFANISFDNAADKRIAFDICPVNIVLNDLAGKRGREFDAGGRMASKGILHPELLKRLNELSYYKIKPPKSLGREWVESEILPILHFFDTSIANKLRTVTEHIAMQIAKTVNRNTERISPSILITGGGAYNRFLIERIAFHVKSKIVLPNDESIQFKEAMAFAFLGVLRMRGEVNILQSVTGAKRDSSGGRIYFPNQNAESSS